MKIVVIARHFPPAISGGSRRPHVLVKQLVELGHDVFTIAPHLPDGMKGLAVSHPAEARIDDGIAQPPTDKDPFLRRLQRDFLLWPDPDRWWAGKVLEAALPQLSEFQPDLVITTSPPESVHYIGAVLSARFQAQWIGDFRDNWLVNPLRQERLSWWRHFGEKRIAKKWLQKMDVACAPIKAILDELKTYSPQTRFHLYPQMALPLPRRTNGPSISGWDDLPPDNQRILHLGSFSLSDPNRTIIPVLEAFKKAQAQNSNLQLCLAGRLSGAEHLAIQTVNNVHWLGLLERGIALSLLPEADALLLVSSPQSQAVPGKLSEYKLAQRPIIVFGPGSIIEKLDIPRAITFEALSMGELAHLEARHNSSPDPLCETRALLEQLPTRTKKA